MMIYEDPWMPSAELLHKMSMNQKLAYLGKAIDKAASDTQFAERLKATLAYIMTTVPAKKENVSHAN